MAGISEIREADATPEIAETYAQIKAASGVPQLNLIWRHFATEPTVLKWAWSAMENALRSGAVERAARALEQDLMPVRHTAAWASLPPSDINGLDRLMAFYTKGNTQNLVGLTALLMWARGESISSEIANANVPEARPTVPIGDIPLLPRRDSLSDKDRALVDGLAGRHGGTKLGVTPSMYLHLSLWDGALPMAEARLANMVGRAPYHAEVRRMIDAGRARASTVMPLLSETGDRPAPAALDPMLDTLENFVTTTIPEMIVVGQLLRGGDIEGP